MRRALVTFIVVMMLLLVAADKPEPLSFAKAAGVYVIQNNPTMGSKITIARNGQFEWASVSDTSPPQIRSRGQAKIEKDAIVIDGKDGSPPHRFIVAKWGQRTYLLAESNLLHFVNSVNGGFEPRSEAIGQFFIRQGDWDKKAEGLPTLPESFATKLLKEPINGQVISAKGIEATINLGAKDGVFVDMAMPIKRVTDGNIGMTRVKEVRETESVLDTGAYINLPVGTLVCSKQWPLPKPVYKGVVRPGADGKAR